MRHLSLFLLLVTAGSLLSFSQSIPDKGSVTGNVYTNKTLGLIWEFPANWQVQDSPVTSDANGQVLLQLLPGGAQSGESVTLTCFDPNTHDENTPPDVDPKAWVSATTRHYGSYDLVLGDGFPVRRYDFESVQEPERYLTSLSGSRKDYDMEFMIRTNSASNLEEIVQRLRRMIKIQPDWPPDSPPIGAYIQQIGQMPGRVRVSPGVVAAMVRHRVAPEYPSEAKSKRIQGAVRLLAYINTDGKVKDLYVQDGPAVFYAPATKALSQWTFQPYLLNGKPIEVETVITIIFGLH
jgi:TonB family protein